MKRRVAQVEQALKQLGNPFDNMSIDQKREHALFLFYRRLQVENIYTKRTKINSYSLSPRVSKNRQKSLCASVWVCVRVCALKKRRVN